MTHFYVRIKNRIYERWHYSRALRQIAAKLQLLALPQKSLSPKHVYQLARGYGRASSSSTLENIAQKLTSVIENAAELRLLQEAQAHGRFLLAIARQPHVTRTLPLKPPGPNGEKGVLLSYFEYNWLRMLHGIPDYQSFTDRWTIVHISSWSPTDYGVLALALARSKAPVYVQSSNVSETSKLTTFHPRLRVLPGLACDWVNPAYFTPLPWEKRDIDILMVANWAPFKRHWELFDALRKLPSDLRVVCVGQPEAGHGLEEIKNPQRQMGVKQKIEFLQCVPIEQVTELQCRSRMAVIMSLREGGCVAAVEALFAGAILGMMDDANVGSRAHINDETGVLLNPGRIHQQIAEALTNHSKFTPREWAIRHISCDVTGGHLNSYLKEEAERRGEPWTQDIAIPCWRPYTRLANANDDHKAAIQSACDALHQSYPEVFAADLAQTSFR